jgi:hypothetical protein
MKPHLGGIEGATERYIVTCLIGGSIVVGDTFETNDFDEAVEDATEKESFWKSKSEKYKVRVSIEQM